MAPRDQDVERLRSIKTFNQLVKYLRDELGWPIENDNFEDIFFDWNAQELGIDSASAAKIEEIKQLRPLSPGQPWGIFFVKFEPKKLPVVALRRILSKLVIKKRTQRGDQAAWKEHDLLFISNYGEGSDRQITFAQFSQPSEKDLPTLKVLGWDDSDTALHIDHTHHTLKNKLTWHNEYKKDFKIWREAWAGAFILRNREVIETSQELAIQLADLARRIRKRTLKVLQIEKDDGVLHQLHAAFQKNLIHDLDQKGFADMYAQTITYGLLAARMSRQGNLVSDHISDMVPVTNPFLKELLETFLNVGGRQKKIDFDELGIQDVVELLNSPETKIDAILRDFGNRTRQEDPVVHFYESFLKEYDAALKVQRGVFYTPQPVVSYIIRSVDELLKTEFGLEDGLASTITWGEMEKKHFGLKRPEGVSKDMMFAQILDPATGTGTFLVEVIDIIYKHLTKKWIDAGHEYNKRLELWNEYVPKYLLTRLYGYELMMAPYTVAHMKIGLKLIETGYQFGAGERLRVYLTNALEDPVDNQYIVSDWFYALAHEAQAVNDIKRHQCFTIIIGNPPYANMSANLSPFARSKVARYKEIDGHAISERNALQLERNVNDDYVKFYALIEDLFVSSDFTIFGFITNNSFLDAQTLRGLRARLLLRNEQIRILDLGGSGDLSGSGAKGKQKDENVFDIQQGVAITIGYRHNKIQQRSKQVYFGRFEGTRDQKIQSILNSTSLSASRILLTSESPLFLFLPVAAAPHWDTYIPLDQCFVAYAEGLKTGFDEGLIGFSEVEAQGKLRFLRDLQNSAAVIRNEYGIGKKGWANKLLVNRRKTAVLAEQALEQITKFVYRPLDFRYAPVSSRLVKAPSRVAGQHMSRNGNLCLIAARQISGPVDFSHFFVSRNVPESRVFYSKKGTATFFPLFTQVTGSLFQQEESLVTDKVKRLVSDTLGVDWKDVDSDSSSQVTPRLFLNYCYAVFHSPVYRDEHRERLKRDFPRLPITSNFDLFCVLAKIGAELVLLHLMESPKLNKHITKFIGDNKIEVETAIYSDRIVWIDKAMTTGFKDIPENVWNFHIGGYQVCQKWLKDRKGRKLPKDEIEHYQNIVVTINETISIMTEVDKVIDSHGGWPKAFQQK